MMQPMMIPTARPWWCQIKSNKIENILVYLPSYRHNRKIFIVALITYIYIWLRFERYFSRHREKIDFLYSFYSKISFIPIWIHSIFTILTIYSGKRSIHFDHKKWYQIKKVSYENGTYFIKYKQCDYYVQNMKKNQ